MKIRLDSYCIVRILAVALLSVLVGGCSGNGQGLDDNGNPLGSVGPPPPLAFEPTFTAIQNNVFTPICVACHAGTAAPQGLSLDPGSSYDLLVRIRSTQREEYFRVQAGNPDASYLVQKLEGSPDISGAPMPLNRPRLSQESINAIRVWIAQGALRN